MTAAGWLLDGALAAALVLLAALALARRTDALQSALLFLGFSFLMVLLWMRLQAPDLALAEVAVSGVVMAVMLLDTLGRLRRRRREERPRDG